MTIHRDDLESKLREIESVVSDTRTVAGRRTRMVIVGAVVITVAYVAFRVWKGKQQKIKVEVYHQP